MEARLNFKKSPAIFLRIHDRPCMSDRPRARTVRDRTLQHTEEDGGLAEHDHDGDGDAGATFEVINYMSMPQVSTNVYLIVGQTDAILVDTIRARKGLRQGIPGLDNFIDKL